MFLGILWEFFSSLAAIYWKKSLGIGELIPSFAFMFLWRFVSFLFVVGICIYFQIPFLAMSVFSLEFFFTLIVVLLTILRDPLRQYTMKREKISTILPFTKLNTVLSIVISFYIFGDVSLISFFIALLIVWVIAISSIDLHSFKIPKTLGVFFLHELSVTLSVLMTWYIFTNIDFLSFYVTHTSLLVILLFCVVLLKWWLTIVTSQEASFYISRFWWATFWTLWYFISLYIMSELWIIMLILISFLWVIFLLLLWFVILWDKPNKKDIVMWVTVMILVWLAFYYK